ncbi:hypothetical protein GCM10007891_24740 [Methylophaga thalassica]|uniref:Uncharacterized protein n=1 Tax=Methylophaga thalassica TaxID=40223 RepID=A0ABQ5TYT1_9GAMM|nr:hypothetical protein [Methylophaga thalassica]GLQ00621.1 hypothetical protein GCM10007891_24740 [Methylophaga thalassica]
MSTENMNYLQTVVFNALQKSTNIADQAEGYARNVNQYIDLLNLDPENRKLVANELGATDEQFSGFLTIVKAIWNGGKCDAEFTQVGDYMSEETRAFLDRYEIVD